MRVVFVVFIVFILSGLASVLTFDAILRILHEKCPEEWVRLNRQYGFFYRPEGRINFYSREGVKSWWALQQICISLNIRTPDWASNDGNAKKLIFKYRFLNIFGFAVLLVFAYCTIYQL